MGEYRLQENSERRSYRKVRIIQSNKDRLTESGAFRKTIRREATIRLESSF